MPKKFIKGLLIVSFSLACLLSCGLETLFYIDYIPEGPPWDINRAEIQLPSSSRDGYGQNEYFSNFIIFYRIYLSTEQLTGIINTDEQRRFINTQLNTDFTNLYRLTDITSTSPPDTSDLETKFADRKYYKLLLEGADITSLLGRSSLDRRLVIEFPSNTGLIPRLTVGGGTSYNLRRASEGPSVIFSPEPDNRLFQNHPELLDNANAITSSNTSTNVNADVYGNTASSLAPRYSFVSMYIAATGLSGEMPPRPIYSQPTFLGIFKLPDAFSW